MNSKLSFKDRLKLENERMNLEENVVVDIRYLYYQDIKIVKTTLYVIGVIRKFTIQMKNKKNIIKK